MVIHETMFRPLLSCLTPRRPRHQYDCLTARLDVLDVSGSLQTIPNLTADEFPVLVVRQDGHPLLRLQKKLPCLCSSPGQLVPVTEVPVDARVPLFTFRRLQLLCPQYYSQCHSMRSSRGSPTGPSPGK